MSICNSLPPISKMKSHLPIQLITSSPRTEWEIMIILQVVICNSYFFRTKVKNFVNTPIEWFLTIFFNPITCMPGTVHFLDVWRDPGEDFSGAHHRFGKSFNGDANYSVPHSCTNFKEFGKQRQVRPSYQHLGSWLRMLLNTDNKNS